MKRRGYDEQLIGMGASLAPRVEEEPPFCWYCDATAGPRDREHIFPGWLQRHLEAERELFDPTHFSYLGGVVTSRGPIPASSLVAGEVCKRCNSGWMSALEVLARPLLFPPSDRAVLTPADQTTLARWFLKTAIALNTSQNYRLLLPREVRHAVRLGMHADVKVFLARHHDPRAGLLNFAQGAQVMAPSMKGNDVPALLAAMTRVYGAAIAVGGPLGVVAYAPPGGWARPTNTDIPQIWPPLGDLSLGSLPEIKNITDGLSMLGTFPTA